MKFFFQNNITYTRGALLALFAGLFILAACGGVNVAPTFIINDPPTDSPCVTNPYGPTCTLEQKVSAIDLCRMAIAGGNDCADNTPDSVVSCLTDPFSAACTTVPATENPFEGTEITIAKEQEKRQETCLRLDTTVLCETAVSSLCSANPFTQTTGDTPTNLCVDISGTAYADARAEACLASPDGAPVDSSCATNTLAEDTCKTAPFGRTGCDNLDEIDGYRTTFCTVTDVFNPSCGDTDEYGATNAARDGFCSDTAAEGNSNCASRLTGICATGTGSNVFAALCGDNAEAETAACQSNSVSVGDSRCSSYETGICTTSGGTAPFAPLCGTNNVASQRIFCRNSNPNDGTCDTTISTFCTTLANASDIYDGLCDVGYTSERLSYCRDTAPDGDTNCDDGNTATLCTTNGGTSPFSRLCGLNVDSQRTFCITNRAHVGTTGNCADTISSFCGSPTLPADIYNDLCDVGYTSERLSYCRDTAPDGDTNCDDGNTATICTTNGGTSPFSRLCGTNNAVNQQTFCVNNRGHVGTTGNCADTISSFCGTPDSPADIYNALCDVGYTSERLDYCRDTAPDGDSECGTDGHTATLCTTNGGTSPFSRLCGENLTNKREFCRDDTGNELCPMTIANFCNDSQNDIFDRLCSDDAGTYDVARGRQCVADGTTDGDCGDENTAGKYIHDYCQDATNANNVTDCPETYENAQTDVTDVTPTTLTGKALNSEGTALLTGADGTTGTAIISSGDADKANDARANFIGGRGEDLYLDNGVTTTRASTLKLDTLGNNSDNASGFAIAVGEFDIGNHRFYVGLLSVTTLGAPLDNAEQGGIWDAKIRILTSIKDNPLLEADFKLNVDFAAKSLKIVNDAGADANINFVIGNARLAFNIDGKFTANGVIYGTVDFTGADNNGTLTGLIGSGGAVGIFKRNGDGSPYVGGFVAAKTDCSATGTPFDADCTDYDLQARLCRDNGVTPVADINANCRDNDEVQARICNFGGTYVDVFNKDICTGGGNDNRRVNVCFRRTNAFEIFGRFGAINVAEDCARDSVITDQICSSNGAYANPFDLDVCPNSDTLRVQLCSHPSAATNPVVMDFDTNCLENTAVTDVVCIPSGDLANPFNTNICPDDTATTNSNNKARAEACSDRTLPRGVNLADNCVGDMAVTDLICARDGDHANPFDAEICTSDEMITITEGEEAKTVLVIKTIQTAFIDNCRKDTANGANCDRYEACILYPYGAKCSATDYVPERQIYATFIDSCRKGTAASEVDCSVYTDCAENPYNKEQCDADNYYVERATYAHRLARYCNRVSGATAPVDAPDCTTTLAQINICASSGPNANPFNATVCTGYAELATIQSEFASACYNARADLTNNPECENIATCFKDGRLTTAAATSTAGAIACDSVAFNDVRALDVCDGYVYGGVLPNNCLQATIDTACDANPFSTALDGIDCINDRTRDAAREQVCYSAASVQYDCRETARRACAIDPFNDLCYDDGTYDDARYAECNNIADEITSGTLLADKSAPAQKCITEIHAACMYDPVEQFNNLLCSIGTFYDTARGEYCLTDAGAKNITDCEDQYNIANDTAGVTEVSVAAFEASGNNKPLNATGTGELTVLDEVQLDDAYTNYVKGNATGLNLEALITKGALVVLDKGNGVSTLTGGAGFDVILDTDALVLSDLDNVAIDGDSENSGVAFAFIDVLDSVNDENSFTDNELGRVDTRGRYYAGLLSGTDLGGPLTDVNGEALWNARFAGYLSAAGEVVFDNTATLLINFATREINTRDGADAFGDADPISMSTLGGDDGDAGSIRIRGKFTDAGVIYGTSSWTATTKTKSEATATPKTASGSVTGLIGAKGAVGAFVSSGTNDDIFEYAGGFVAAPFDCSADGTPFHVACGNDSAGQQTFCKTGVINIFDERCGAANQLSAELVTGTYAARRAACSVNGGAQGIATDEDCVDTVLRVCGSERGQLDTPFHSACKRKNEDGAYVYEAYVVARGEACFDQYFSPSTGTCGDEDTPNTYLYAYCATDAGRTNVTYCDDAYAAANPVANDAKADVATLTAKALNAEGTALLPTFIADGEATTTDGRSNFIDGGATALNLGDAVTANADIPARNLTLSDDATSGFAIASVGSGFSKKYYVGILSNTDLGVLLTVQPNVDWTGKLSITGTSIDGYDEGGVYDITLDVDFDKKELSLKDGSLDIENEFPELLTLDIDGKFTANGVIYGRVVIEDEFGDTDFNNASLTGLIGVEGAVGIFKSNLRTDTTYVGGFVVAPSIDCSADGTPFDPACLNNIAAQTDYCENPETTWDNMACDNEVAYGNTTATRDMACLDAQFEEAPDTDCEDRSSVIETCRSNPFDSTRPGCKNLDMIGMLELAYCENPETTWDNMACDNEVAYGTTTATRDMACLDAQFEEAPDTDCEDRSSVIETCRPNPFDSTRPGCKNLDMIGMLELAYCENPETTWDNMACDDEVAYGNTTATRDKACLDAQFEDAPDTDCEDRSSVIETCRPNPFDSTRPGCKNLDMIGMLESAYCENPATTWDNAACDDETAYGNTKITRNNACLDYGIGADGDASCENRKNVRSACSKNLFMKTRKGTPTDLCIGTDATGRLYSAIRTQICTTPTVRSFHESCNGGAYGDEVATRNEYCTDNALVGDAKCQEEGLTDKFCGTTGSEINVFATVCTVARRVTYCRLNVSESACADTITTFCNSASDTDLFSPICNTGDLAVNFNDYRVAACSATDERTGAYSTCTDVLNMYCHETGTRSPSCAPVVVDTLPASVWVASARNANDTARLNVLDEVGLDDAYTNYVQGGENGLNLTSVISKADGTIIDSDFDNVIDVIFEGDVLSLSDFDHLDESDALSGGVAFAFIDVFNLFEEEKSFTDNALGRVDTRGRYYAGLLSGTDLGGPLTSVDGTAIWDARFAGYLSAADGVVFDDETSLLINFGTKEINTRDTADAVDMFGGVDINNNFISAGIISIDGEFTDAGVIFGISSWTALTKTKSEATATPKTAHGTLTGLIGKYGAVGAFVSSGTNDGIFEYAGGFVAAPVDCRQTGTPFHRLCTNNLATQRDFCRADKDNELCPMTIANFCNDSANDIFDSLCSDDAGTYDFARGRQCVANGTTGGDCGDEDSGYIQDYCDTAAGLTNVTHCPNKYAGANPVNRDTDVVDVATLTGKALNAEGTGLETVVDNGKANTATDDRANFIVGGESDVKLGINRASKKTIRLNPDAGDQTDEYKSGFAIARAINTDYQNYYYVGLLSGTNVGALLPNANETTTLEWSAKLTILLGASFAPEQTFTLLVELSGRTIGVKPGSAPSGTLGFSINGKFTKNGLLYGRFASNLGGAGTLTGLIGQKGAVGIFKSNPNSTPYVGGFVATASINCTAVGTPFHVDCTDNADVQAKACIANNAAAMVDFNANCRDNPEVQARVCEFGGSHVNVFNRDVCADGASDFRRVRVCFRRTNAFHIFGSFGGFNGAMDCVGDPVIKAEICRANGQYANPFDTVICPDSDNESVAVRAGLCSNHSIKPVADFDTNCLSGAITSLVCRASGANANPFDKSICPDDTATTNSNNIVRAQACSDRAMTPLPNGVNVGADCARDTAVTDIICTSSGANANPFDRDICTSDDMTTIGEGDEEKTVLTITIAQSAFVKNCRADNAEGSSTTTAGGADCSRYTDCAENPYLVTCDADNYHVERSIYANQFVEFCSGVDGVDAPVGAPDSCTDELAQATICTSSGEYANPFHATICAGYDGLAAIQSEFATMCYNTRTDLRKTPECENIATCFASGKLGIASATSTTGGIACDNVAFNDVVALENTLASCDTQVSGATLISGCLQPTVTEVCNANPFSVIENDKGIDCLSDTAFNNLRERFCINDDTNPAYNCSATTTRVCETENNPFSDLCYDNATYEQARYDTCDGISGDITPNTVRTNEDNTLQNCLDTIDYECQYSETEKFDNDFCKIGTLYDAERGRLCLYGYTDVDDKGAAIPTPAECSGNTIYEVAYCSELAPEGNAECSGRVAEICTTDNGTAPFAPLCGENLTAQTEFCTKGTTTIFDTRCASADGLTQTIAGTNNARRDACGGNEGEVNRATDAQCVDTVLRVCGSEAGQLNTPFHAACRRKNEDGTYVYQAYVVARAEACFVQGFSPPTGTCGTEDLGTHIKEYCATDAGNTNITHCPKKYAGANPVNIGDTADVATLTAKALNAEGTALLPTFIADGAANTATDDYGVSVEDSASNFIVGGATGLNLGDAVTENTDDAVTETLTDTRDGFAIATAGTADTRKYYVGILSGTDVGAPLTEQPTFVLWRGTLRIRTPNKRGVYNNITFRVNFQEENKEKNKEEEKTFKLENGAFDISTKFPELLTLDINGKFTASGLLYGRIVIKDKDGGLNNASLTGLIGVRGAVGIFASDDDATTTYVGGFAVENGGYTLLVDCTAEETPFHPFCDNDVKLELCGGTLDVLMAAMDGSPAACNAADLSGVICASSGTQANPFAPICSEDMATAIISGYDQATTQLDFVNNCDTDLSALDGATCSMEITDCLANLFGSGCDAPQYADVRNTFCTKTDIFDERCGEIATEVDIVDGTNMARDMVCAKYGTNAGGHSSCETRPNVRMACDRNPFTKITADGITDLCTGTDVDGVDGVNYSEARDACKVPATSFAENCNSQDNIGKVKLARDMACAESGIAAGMDIMAVNDCATRQNIMDACTTISPFTNKGCDTATHITPEIREAYCTNGTTDIFNPKCGLLTDTIDLIDGTNNAREMACLNSQISMPIDDSCKTNVRVVMACTTDPFTKVGCGNVSTIATIRGIFCTETDIFNSSCGDTNDYGDTNEARRDACLADTGTPSDPSCRTNALAEDICQPNPFNEAKPGCANLDKNFQYRTAYCTMGLNIFSPNCGDDDKYGATNAARDTAIRGCITPDDTRLVEGICINAVNANPCIETPFDSNCVDDFADYYQDARTKRTTFCAGLAHNNHSLCVGAIAANPCFNNPFNLANGPTSCSSEFTDRREVLINKCIVDAVGQTPDCDDVRAGIGGCLENPFQDSCEAADNFYFKDYADSGRAARVAFCDIDGDNIKVHAYCPAGSMFERDICTYNPYGSFCNDDSFDAGLNTTVEAQRTKKIIDCGDNAYKYPGSCAHVFTWATAATWALGEDGEDGRPFNTRPTAKNQFLRTTSVSELDKTGASSTSGAILNLTTATFDHKKIVGDKPDDRKAEFIHDGVEFFQGVVDSSEYYYAGILGAANLGSPLSGATRTMYWNGQISSTKSIGTTNSKTSGNNSKDFTTSDAGGVIVATDFTLTINFDGSGGTVESFTKAFLDDSTSKYYYDIEGTFNERGLITSGTVAYAVFTDGDEDSRVADSITDATLSGIIGEDGALGVFQGADFAGGFVVHSTFKARVESADWELSFDTAPLITPTAKNQFLQQGMRDGVDTSSTTITAGGGNAPMVENLILNQSFFDRINNQVFWFSGFIGSTQYHYAGISGLANLDATLTPATPSGTWYGSFGVGEHTTDFALDIAFARRNGVSGGTISAFVRESAGIYYLLEGYFDRAGVITGTVNYGAFTNGVRTDAVAGRTANGVLTGLIGQGGALGAFHSTALGADGYAGGFYAHPTTTAFGTVADYDDWVRSLEDFTPSDIDDVDYDDWERSFLFLAAEPDTSTPQNQFLKTFNRIRTTGTTATQVGGTPTVRTLDLLNATNFDGDALGGLAGNAVRWFSGYIGATEYHYAGVFDDADLGKPLTETPVGGEWRGVIGVGGLKTDFTLTITYGATGGTISAFVRDTPNVYYLLDGGFDANGLIDGTVRYGAFTNPSTAVGNTVDGVLTGLIGADGALGVFHSTATGAAGYSGGFVARPGAPEYAVAVKYSDYRRGFLTLDTPDTTSPKNQFVTDRAGVKTKKTNKEGTDITRNTLALDTTTFDDRPLGGAAGNSLFWFDGFVDRGMRRYYAGLDTTVNLGAPIIGGDGTTAGWRGVFGLGNAKTDFTLNITFTATGGLISAFVHELEDNYYLLDGEFDAHGLITGTVRYSEFTNRDKTQPVGARADGILIGLIGEEGAIGAFYSTATGPTGYSGGFVARDNVADFVLSTVGYKTWVRGFLLSDAPDQSDPRHQFLRAKADGTLDTTDSNNTTIIVDLDTATFNGAPIGGLAANRYQSFDRNISNKQRNYIGILPEGDLGAPVTQANTTELTWYGNFRGGFDGALTHVSDFILYLTINGAVGTLSARANYHNTDYYVLDGTFDAGGVITGTVAYNLGSFEATPNGILTGIIGVNGAIGVFISEENAATHYVGGFVAKPKTQTFTDSVGYSDWVGRANPVSTLKNQNQFSQTDDERISTGTTTFTSTPVQYTLNLNSTLYDGAPILGDINDGVAYFKGTISGRSNAFAYAGIFDTTDLGAPLAQTTQSFQWKGVVGLNGATKRANFTINFNGKDGLITAFIRDIIGENDFRIAGTFDDLGLITGTTHYAQYTNSRVTGAVIGSESIGILSGLIGREGAVAAFYGTGGNNDNYSGGFIASEGVRPQVNASAWLAGFGRNPTPIDTTPDTTIRQNQFLDGKTTTFPNIKISTSSSETVLAPITFLGLGSKSGAAEATYKSIPLGGYNTGGVSYLYGFQSGTSQRLHYAYVNNDSKIGTRIERTSGTAKYHGQFSATSGGYNTIDFTTNTDFTLTVTFGGAIDDAQGAIWAFVPEGGVSQRYYHLEGTYDDTGGITGTVEFGEFTNNNRLMWKNTVLGGKGLLTGLIGKNNVLGVFLSVSPDVVTEGVHGVFNRGGRTGESPSRGFVGGFVAHRFAPDNDTQNVRYTDWTQWFRPREKADTLTPKNQFLTTLRGISRDGTTAPTAITTVTLNDDGIYYDPVTLTGDAKDGFAYFTAGDYGYVGILDSTDLGAPLRGFNGTKATWHGQINFRTVAKDFAININYGTGGGTVDGFSANIVDTTDFALEGTFGANGVITGLTNFAQYTGDSVGGAIIDPASAQAGILTGIIGQEGAVGVFHSTALGANGYVGGFVVHPQVVDSADVNYSDWIRGKSYHTDPPSSGGTQFLKTTDGVISTEMVAIVAGEEVRTPLANLSPVTYLTLNNATFGIKNTVGRMTNFISYNKKIGGEFTPFSFTYESNTFEGLEIGGDERNGLAYFSGGSEPYVGILDTTNLGKPLVRGAKTVLNWGGHLGIIVAHNSDSTLYNRDLTLKITLTDTGGNIDATVNNLPIFNGDSDDVAFVIDGEFNSQGVITGTVNYGVRDIHGDIVGDRFSVAPLTGIIGQEGAVGVFRGRSRGYAGGFVAHPDVVDRVVYADWVQANPVLGEKEDPVDKQPIRTTSGFDDFQSVTLFGAWDSPARGNHFLTTKNDVIGIGSASSDPNFNNLIRVDDRTQELVNNSYPQIAVTPRYLRFDDFTFGGETINTEAEGGIAGFTGRFGTKATFYTYVGILDSTDLGPALMESVDVAWQGRFFYNDFVSGFNDNFSVQRDFTLNITFKGTGGEVWGFLANIGDNAEDVVEGEEINTAYFQTNDIYLQGKFGFDGVISGNTLLKQFPKNEYTDNSSLKIDLQDAIANVIHPAREPKDDDPTTIYPDNSGQQERVNSQLGILTGLIGQHGAVGVWHAINWSASNGGGFIVAPPASSDVESAVEHYAAWQASFASTPAATITPAENRFLSDSDTVFDDLTTEPLGAGTTAPITTLNMETNTNNSVSFANGYFNNAGTTIRSFYALIGSNANLGATLPIWQNGQTASATWQGTFAAGRGDGTTTNTSFDLAVDFQNRAVEAFVPITPASITHYHLRGEFPVDLNGAIIGTVDHGNFTDSNRLLPTGDSNRGVFTGLIGTRGAIGAFISGTRTDNSSTLTGGTGDTGYSGGFVARP